MGFQIKIKYAPLWFRVKSKKSVYGSVSKRVASKRSTKSYLKNKEKARALVIKRLNYYNTFYGFKWNRVAIKNTKRRWGSCSKKGNLNFCYKVALLPQDLADYVIVHELCHLGQFNHSKAFWALVAKTIPDYKNTRSKLKNVRLI